MRNPPNETSASIKKSHPQPLQQGLEGSAGVADPTFSSPRVRARARGGSSSSEPHVPERTCILTRRAASRGELIRLALGPDDSIAPDIRARAPGRGAWIGVDRPALEAAQAKGKLKAALARAFKTAVTVPDDLGEHIEAALRQAALDRLGLEAKAGHIATGSEKIDSAARRGEVHLLIHAADGGADGCGKLDQALRVGAEGSDQSGGRGLVFPEGRAILSVALGRHNVVHVAALDRAAAARIRTAIARWAAFIGRDAALRAAPTAPGASAVSYGADEFEGLE